MNYLVLGGYYMYRIHIQEKNFYEIHNVSFHAPFLFDAVGTPITERPPHRTVRAVFPHTALHLG